MWCRTYTFLVSDVHVWILCYFGQTNYSTNILNQYRSYFHWKYAPYYSKTTSFFYYFTAEHQTQLVKLTAEIQNFCYSSSNADSSAKAGEATGIATIGGHHCISIFIVVCTCPRPCAAGPRRGHGHAAKPCESRARPKPRHVAAKPRAYNLVFSKDVMMPTYIFVILIKLALVSSGWLDVMYINVGSSFNWWH